MGKMGGNQEKWGEMWGGGGWENSGHSTRDGGCGEWRDVVEENGTKMGGQWENEKVNGVLEKNSGLIPRILRGYVGSRPRVRGDHELHRRGGRGVRGQKNVCVPKINLQFRAPLTDFIFS